MNQHKCHGTVYKINISIIIFILKISLFILGLTALSVSLTAQSFDLLAYDKYRWLPVSNRVSVANAYEIVIYTPDFTFVDRYSIVNYPSEDKRIINYEWSPDETRLAILFDDNSRTSVLFELWDVASHQKIDALGDVHSLILEWSPDSQYLALNRSILSYNSILFVNGNDGTLHYDWETVLNFYLAWHPTDQQVATHSQASVSLWDISVEPPQLITNLIAARDDGLDYNQSGSQLAFVPADQGSNIIIYNTQTYEPITVLHHPDRVGRFRWGSFPLSSIGSGGRALYVWDTTAGQPLLVVPGLFADPPEWSPDGTMMLLNSKELGVHIRSGTTGEVLATLNDALATPTPTPNLCDDVSANSADLIANKMIFDRVCAIVIQ